MEAWNTNNTIPENNQTDDYSIPKEYIYWELQWFKDNFSESEITKIQQQLLASILVGWDIQIFQVLETERLQDIKLSRRPIFNRDLQSVPLSEIAPWDKRESIVRNLEQIWAQSAIFERYAWSRWRFSWDNAQ